VTAAQLKAPTFGVRLLATLGSSTLSPRRVSVVANHFGTGYSDLQNLHRLRLDRIKIDPTFIGAMLHDRQAATMVKALMGIGKGMDRRVRRRRHG
jgi:EAL domain-containing protein (putative c-di-GMP-specific phosphodiesterase class I)